VRTLRAELLIGLAAQVAVLAALAGTVGLTVAGRLAGLAYGLVVVGLLARALARAGATVLGPANRVTLARAVLVGGITALVGDSFVQPVPVAAVAALTASALVLDAVDGRVARHTGSVSAVGARFDVEVDSFLVLVLSLSVARSLGPWVVLLGAPHYVLVLAGRVLPWLRRQAPPRPWCKVVAAIQGIALATVTVGVLPGVLASTVLGVVAVLLAESFGREIGWLWHAQRRDTGRVLRAPVVEVARG
jgi:phosphatidylglycerophosphate synthase